MMIRLQLQEHVHAIVAQWVEFIERQGCKSILLDYSIAAHDGGRVEFGMIDERLQELGYQIVSHSCETLGEDCERDEAGNPKEGAPRWVVARITFFVRRTSRILTH